MSGSERQWVQVASLDDLEEEEGHGVVHDGRRYALFLLDDGRVYAMDDVCSHEFSLLSEGQVWDEEVYCEKHGSRFNIKTGAVRGLPATQPVRTYPVKVEGGAVYIGIEE